MFLPTLGYLLPVHTFFRLIISRWCLYTRVTFQSTTTTGARDWVGGSRPLEPSHRPHGGGRPGDEAGGKAGAPRASRAGGRDTERGDEGEEASRLGRRGKESSGMNVLYVETDTHRKETKIDWVVAGSPPPPRHMVWGVKLSSQLDYCDRSRLECVVYINEFRQKRDTLIIEINLSKGETGYVCEV